MPALTRTLFVLSFAAISSFGPVATAQVPDPVVAAEAPVPGAGHNYIGNGAETVNPADGSVTFDLPLQPPAGRGLSASVGIRYSGGEQFFLSNSGTNSGNLYWHPSGEFGSGPFRVGGWSYDLPVLTATTSIFWSAYVPDNGCPNGVCTYSLNFCYGNDSYVFRGLDGIQYSVPLGSVFPDPNNKQAGFCPAAPDNLKGPGNTHGILSSFQSDTLTTVVDHSGTTYQFPVGSGAPSEPINPPGNPIMWGTLATSITDRNGNQLTLNGNSYKDSTGRTAVAWTGIGNTGDQITVSGLGGPVTLSWTTTPVAFPETGYSIPSSGPSSCTLAGSNTNSISVLSEIDLPNGQRYTFQYDGTYGKVSKITFPDGGYVRYVWGLYTSAKATHAAWTAGVPGTPESCDFIFDIPTVTDRYVSFDGSSEVLHQHFAYALPAWSGNTWSSKQTTVTSTDLLTGQVTKTIYTYGSENADNNVWVSQALYSLQVPVETNVLYQDGSGRTYKEVNKAWAGPNLLAADQTILYDNAGSRTAGSATVRCYDANEQITNLYEYGFQTEGAYPGNSCSGGLNTSYIGPLRRQTATVYHPFFNWNGTTSPPSWTGTHIVNAPDSITVADGSGATAKQTLYTYDQNAPQSSGAINLTNPGPTRANVTTVQRLIQSGSYAATTYTYYDTGQVASMTDPCGNSSCSDMSGSNHITSYSYLDGYAAGTGTPPGQTFAYLTQVTHPNTGVAHTERFSWGFNDGLLHSHTDVENNLTTSYAYADPLLRLTQIVNPDGGQTNIYYNDGTPAPTVTTSKQINGSVSLTSVSVRDGMGHIKQTQLTSDPQGTVYADTTFDGFGRVWKQSNPYRAGSDVTSTQGLTILTYDAVGRKIAETYPDNSVLTTAYCGASTLVTDPTGRWRRSRTDSLGLLVEVDEPNAVGATVASSGCPGTGEPIWVTSYTNDVLGNLTQVVQNGSRQRNFTFDFLSRLLTSTNPEVGAISYVYDSNGNVATKTDARNIITTYSYDVLSRPLSRAYSNGDPSVSMAYDQSDCLGLGQCQNDGHLTSMTDAAGSEAWSFDVLGRTNKDRRTTEGITKDTTYNLDSAGNTIQVTFPTGRVVNYGFDAADRPISVQDASNGTLYATDWLTPPGSTNCSPTAVCYTPQGTFYAVSIGQTSSFTGLNLTHTYNNRLQPQEFKASSTSGNAIDLTYSFVDPGAGGNAGHVYGITNNLDSTRSQIFSYDQLNRITSALTASTYSTSAAHCWGESYSLDPWGNLTSIAATTNPAYNGCSQESGFTTVADGSNHLSGWAYDASGNATSDGTIGYNWNAESELMSASGMSYRYDGEGRRVEKVGSKLYWYDGGNEVLAETDASGNTTAEYVYFGGKRIAMLAPSASRPGAASVTISGSEQSISGPAATAGTGSVTFSGTLQSKQVLVQAATPGTGSVALGGSLQSKQVQTQAAAAGTGWVSISGSERSYTFDPCVPHGSCPQTVWDGGTISITVNGVQAGSTGYGGSSTPSSLASALASSINGNSSSPVTASAGGSTVYLTAKTTGASTNYSLSASSYTQVTQYFSGTSFPISTSGSNLTGGADAAYTTVYDSGTCSVTVNGHGDSASWSGSGTTASSIASALGSNINGDGSSPITASVSGNGVNLTAKTTGAASNYSLSTSCTYDSGNFGGPSFTSSPSGSSLTGGADAIYNTVYDSGSSTVIVNGHPDTVSWSGSGTTSSSIASALVSFVNGDSGASVTASLSGSTVNLTAKSTGASTNYTLSSSSTYDSANFGSASFTSSNSGSTLTGGHDAGATTYDSGNVWITIDGTQYSVSYGQSSSSSTVASALASTISAGTLANATANGSSISITAKSNGSATNYSLSAGSSTTEGAFASASFSTAPSGGSLTGGADGVFYYAEDMLGTSRVLTDSSGNVCYDADFYPYGGERAYLNNCPQNYRFEGKERDPETDNDDFGARYYSNRFGRWLSADWSAVPVPVPYANLTNPQTLNLYSMVADDPESFADLDGHQEAEPDAERPPSEEEVRETRERDEVVTRILSENNADAAEQLAAVHDAWLRGQTLGYDDPLTGDCYAPNPKAGLPTMRSADSQANGPYENSPENNQRMSQGKAPIGKDGKPVELHHEGQKATGQLKEMTQADHRGGENFKKNHPNTGQQPSQIDRDRFKQQRQEYWKNKLKPKVKKPNES